ncbi:MAG: 4Fe-4S dicluster domain-containing protein [Syntrophomonadaceae bacterium]|nr:4Fe-4S dicluster domain-containing protein [Syntrophomonadaceae bacterium]
MRIISLSAYCLGCGLCEIHCASYHDGYQGNILKAYKKGTPVARSRVLKVNGISWLNVCRQCREAPCVNSCISGALKKDAQGMVNIDETQCIGCLTCVMVCPYGHIQPDKARYRVIKCDLCKEKSGDPACVAGCPNGALEILYD